MADERYTIFTSGKCPWCTKVIQVMANLGLDIDVVSLRMNSEALNFMQEHNLTTVPQVFLGDKLIGGYEATIQHLGKKGLLKA